MRSGIYEIRNAITGKKYVGSSIDCRKRLNGHRWELDNACHTNPHLQNSWSKYEPEDFVFEQVEEIPPEECLTREQEIFDETIEAGGWVKPYNK